LNALASPPVPPTADLEAAILAGGDASRLGGADKRALLVGGAPVLDRQLAALRALASRIVVIGRSSDRVQAQGLEVVPDETPGCGPLGGIYTALVHARAGRVLALACDLPFVTSAFLGYLADVDPGADVTVPRDSRGWHPLCAVWRAAVAPHLREQLDAGARAVHAVLGSLRVHVVEGEALARFDPDGWLLHNINTPDDYRRAAGRTG
jgi:molybdopterin-guanine dinucleotide biosynthesis protein A